MNEESLSPIESKKYLDDQVLFSQVQQLAFGNAVSTIVSTPIVPTAATNLYATSTVGSVSYNTYNKKEVDDASLFMDDKLKILAASPYTISLNNMHKLDDISAISLSSRYAITEYFNIIYYDNLYQPGSRCNYAINSTKNIIKHKSFLTQTLENIAQHSGEFPVGKIKYKWENLHKALIWLSLKIH